MAVPAPAVPALPVETFFEFRNFVSKSLISFPKLLLKKEWRSWESFVRQQCAGLGLESLLSEEKQPAMNVDDSDASVATFSLAHRKYIFAVMHIGLKLREAIPTEFYQAYDLLPKFTRAALLTDIHIHAARQVQVEALVTVQTVNAVPLAHTYPHPCTIMTMLRHRITATLPSETNVEIEKLHAIRIAGNDFDGMMDRLKSQIKLLDDLNIPTPDAVIRALVCKAVDKQAQTLADTLTSNVAITTDQMIAAFSAHYKTRAIKSGTGKAVVDDAVVLSVVVEDEQGSRGRGGSHYSNRGGRGTSGSYRGRSSSRGRGGSSRGRGSLSPNQDRRCYSCKRLGHIARDCRYTKESPETKAQPLSQALQNINLSNTSQSFCTRCGSTKHSEEKCRFTKRVQKLQAKLAGVGEDGGVDGFMIRVFHGGVWQNMMLLNFHSTQHPTVI